MQPLDQVQNLIEASAAEPRRRHGQRALAAELTDLVHGADATAAAEHAARALFGGAELDALDEATLGAALRETPWVPLPADRVASTPVAGLFVECGLMPSRGAVRRAAAEGGIYVNNERVGDVDAAVPADRLLPGGWLVLRRGRRTVGAVQAASAEV